MTRLNAKVFAAAGLWACTIGAVAAAPAADDSGWQIADRAETERNPVPLDRGVLARGETLYRSKCQRCHAVDGRGHGPEADPNHPAGDLTDARRTSRNPDGVMFYKIWNGRAKPKMPAMKADLPPADVWTIIHYVKTLRRGDLPPAR
jgi:mono/diheme cytochrome c family protein